MGLRGDASHLAENRTLVTHRAPRVRETQRAIKLPTEGHGGGIPRDEMQVAGPGLTCCFSNVATLVVDSDTAGQMILEGEQMPARAAADVHNAHPGDHDVVEE